MPNLLVSKGFDGMPRGEFPCRIRTEAAPDSPYKARIVGCQQQKMGYTKMCVKAAIGPKGSRAGALISSSQGSPRIVSLGQTCGAYTERPCLSTWPVLLPAPDTASRGHGGSAHQSSHRYSPWRTRRDHLPRGRRCFAPLPGDKRSG